MLMPMFLVTETRVSSRAIPEWVFCVEFESVDVGGGEFRSCVSGG